MRECRRRCAGRWHRWNGKTSALEAEGLERILDEADLASRIEHKLLVPLPASAALTVNPNLIENHRYCRPWTAQFLADLARAHAAAFHKPIQVNSAVRTVEYQKRLMRTNGNAADAEGDIVSPHLTGATIDIAKQGLSRAGDGVDAAATAGTAEGGQDRRGRGVCAGLLPHHGVQELHDARGRAQEHGEPGAGSARRKAGQPAPEKPASQLPADLAAGCISPRRDASAWLRCDRSHRLPKCHNLTSTKKFIATFAPGEGTIAGEAEFIFWRKAEIMSEMEVQPAAEPAAGLTQWQRVSNTFMAPSKTFEDIKRGNKSWWMPLIIMAVVGYIFFAAVYTKIGMQQVVDNQIRMDPEAAARMAQADAGTARDEHEDIALRHRGRLHCEPAV